jgi:hypothetical protein
VKSLIFKLSGIYHLLSANVVQGFKQKFHISKTSVIVETSKNVYTAPTSEMVFLNVCGAADSVPFFLLQTPSPKLFILIKENADEQYICCIICSSLFLLQCGSKKCVQKCLKLQKNGIKIKV